MSNTWCVYCHQNKINGKKYFGITSRKPQYRWGSKGNCYSFYFGRAIVKYGWNNFEHLILFSGLDKETAIMFEQYLIAEFKTKDKLFGYNLTDGGDGALNPSMETRKRLSERQKGHIVTEETRRKLSESNKGKHNPSAETRAKISVGNKGKVMSAEARAKISKNHSHYNLGRKMSDEQKAKISATKRARKFTPQEVDRMYATRRGRHLSEERKAEISAKLKAFHARKRAEKQVYS